MYIMQIGIWFIIQAHNMHYVNSFSKSNLNNYFFRYFVRVKIELFGRQEGGLQCFQMIRKVDFFCPNDTIEKW